MKYYDPVAGRYRLKRRYSYAFVGFAAGTVVGLVLGLMV